MLPICPESQEFAVWKVATLFNNSLAAVFMNNMTDSCGCIITANEMSETLVVDYEKVALCCDLFLNSDRRF